MKNIFLTVLFFCLSLLPVASWAVESPCAACHEEVAAQSRSGRYVHQPFLKGQCDQCHIVGKSVAVPIKRSPLAIEKEQVEKILWFQSVTGREQEHWLRLPVGRLTAGLYLKATDGRMRSPLQEVRLPSESSLVQKLDDGQAPLQANLSVTDVRRGITTTATLQWETDEYTDSILYYGVGNLRSVKTDSQLTRQHSLVLLGLAADKTYQYQIVSRDLFGNKAKSPVAEFSTAESFWNQDASYRNESPLAADIDLQWELYRVKTDYLLVIKADRPVSLSLGTDNRVTDQNAEERQVVTSESFSHPILKSSFDTNITVCKACHRGLREEYSHPINVRPRSGMVIPVEYPVLPDGKISCMSCHASHASDNEYRLIKPGKAELCRGCHVDY